MVKKIRLAKHFRCSKRFFNARDILHQLMFDMSLPSEIRRKLISVEKLLETPRSLLDDHYHDIISDAEFNKYGHIYYNVKGKAEARTSFNATPVDPKCSNLTKKLFKNIIKKGKTTC